MGVWYMHNLKTTAHGSLTSMQQLYAHCRCEKRDTHPNRAQLPPNTFSTAMHNSPIGAAVVGLANSSLTTGDAIIIFPNKKLTIRKRSHYKSSGNVGQTCSHNCQCRMHNSQGIRERHTHYCDNELDGRHRMSPRTI